MSKDPAFLLYYKDYLVSCSDWDADVFGWYMRLIFHQADKPEGLPDDLEALATLAGVKISQFERFKECWKRTLQARFKANASGLLCDERQTKVLNDRRDYTNKQSIRGTVGAFIKKNRAKFSFTDKEWKDATRHVILYLTENSKQFLIQGESLIHNLLQAYATNIIVDVNADANEEEIKIKSEAAKNEAVKYLDQKLSEVFNPVTRETFVVGYSEIDVDDQWEKFKVKVKTNPKFYALRDASGLSLAFNRHLQNAPKRNEKPSTDIILERKRQFENS